MGKIARLTWRTAAMMALGLLAFGWCCGRMIAQTESFQTPGSLGRLVDFVMQVGKPTVLNAPAAQAFGLGDSEVPMRGLAFKPPGDDHVHIVLVSANEGRSDIVLTHTTLDQVGPMWLTSPSGLILKTIYEDKKGVSVVTDGRFNADFEAQKAYLLSRVPGG